MTKYETFEANGRKYSAWINNNKVIVQDLGSLNTETLRVRAGDWDDIMNSCFFKELVYIDRYIVCIDVDDIIFARNNYNY